MFIKNLSKSKAPLEINLTDIVTKRIAVHCKRRKEAELILNCFYKKGCTWYDGKPMMKNTHYSLYNKYTCYTVDDYKDVYFDHIECCKAEGYRIVEFKDLATGRHIT